MPSLWVPFAIALIALGLVALLAGGVWRAETALGNSKQARFWRTSWTACALAVWLAAQAAFALSGVLGRFDLRPPPMLLWFGSTFGLGLGVALSPFGRRLSEGLSLAALVAFQSFRLPLELVMHEAARHGIMPSVMSYSGYNFDILTGITAIPVAAALLVRRAPLWLVWLWNIGGLLLLLVIASIAVAASPVVRAFGDGQLNVWVTEFPYVWMAVMVGSALFGHVLVFRKLRAQGDSSRMSQAGFSEPETASRVDAAR